MADFYCYYAQMKYTEFDKNAEINAKVVFIHKSLTFEFPDMI